MKQFRISKCEMPAAVAAATRTGKFRTEDSRLRSNYGEPRRTRRRTRLWRGKQRSAVSGHRSEGRRVICWEDESRSSAGAERIPEVRYQRSEVRGRGDLSKRRAHDSFLRHGQSVRRRIRCQMSDVRCPRSEVRGQRSAGSPVRSSAGRTFAAIPKSIIQTSPGLTLRIVVLHAIEHQCPVKR